MADVIICLHQLFQSTLSVRRATIRYGTFALSMLFQSTLSVRRATAEWGEGGSDWVISIHALREESDFRCRARPCDTHHFNPRSP